VAGSVPIQEVVVSFFSIEVYFRSEAFVSRSVVAVVKTSPSSVVDDVGRAMELAGYQDALSKEHNTHLKINISWHVYYPACSTTPWQLDGVIKRMLDDGYSKQSIIAAHNSTVVVDSHVGEVNNHLSPVIDKYGLERMWLESKLDHVVQMGEEESEIARMQPWGGSPALIASDCLFSFGAHLRDV